MQKDDELTSLESDALIRVMDAVDALPYSEGDEPTTAPDLPKPLPFKPNRSQRRRMQQQKLKPLRVPPKLQTGSHLHRLPPAHDAVVNAVTRGNVSYEYLAQRQGLSKTAVRLSVRAGLKRAREMTL
ncbi:MAG TPA: hypothetical protein VIU40_13215 [Geobacteraceae bacterium]